MSAADFALSGGHALSGTSGSGMTWTMAVSPAVLHGETITSAYSGTSIEDELGNPMATFSGASVTNNSSLPNSPKVSSWRLSSNRLSIIGTLSSSDCSPSSGTGHFTLGKTLETVTGWTISGSILTLTLSGKVSAVTVSYAQDGLTDITDVAGNLMPGFNGTNVTSGSSYLLFFSV